MITEAQISADALGDLLGISGRRVKQLRADGVLPGAPGQRYDVRSCIRAYCAHLRPSSGRAAAGGANGATLNEARIALLAEQTKKLLIENDISEGRLILVEDVTRKVSGVSIEIRDKLLAIPSAHAAELARLKTPAAVAGKLDLYIRDALEALYQFFIGNALPGAGDTAPEEHTQAEKGGAIL